MVTGSRCWAEVTQTQRKERILRLGIMIILYMQGFSFLKLKIVCRPSIPHHQSPPLQNYRKRLLGHSHHWQIGQHYWGGHQSGFALSCFLETILYVCGRERMLSDMMLLASLELKGICWQVDDHLYYTRKEENIVSLQIRK